MKQHLTLFLFSIVLLLGIISCKQKNEPFDASIAAAGVYSLYAIDTNGVQSTVKDSTHTITVTKKTSTSADIIQQTDIRKTYSDVTLSDNGNDQVGLSNTTYKLTGYTEYSFIEYTIISGTDKIIFRGKKR